MCNITRVKYVVIRKDRDGGQEICGFGDSFRDALNSSKDNSMRERSQHRMILGSEHKLFHEILSKDSRFERLNGVWLHGLNSWR